MRRGECAFELREQLCVECGKPSGQEGTCEDVIYCRDCRDERVALDPDVVYGLIRVAEDPPTLALVDDGEDEDQ